MIKAMETQDKEILLKDLSARLPYKPQVVYNGVTETLSTLHIFDMTHLKEECVDIKPYLRPMLSMTEEEDKEWQLYKSRIAESCDELLEERIAELHDWFCKKHLDFRGLIPKGLAIEAPNGMYDF